MPAVSPPPATVNFDEGPSPFVQPNASKKKMTSALVYYLDDTEHTFHIHKKAKGSVLIDMVIAQMGLVERDYFGLAFYDEQKTQHWLYPDKKIEKQLKGLPLEFFFKVKFYPPQPTQLSEDFSRHLLYLQLRKDVYSERLPVGFVAQASLGSLVAQAVLGDYQPMEDYASHLNNTKIAQPTTEQVQFINHVRELHKNHRGLTRQEAELAYLNECKGLALYGMHLFPAKDSKNKPVQVGVSFHGISVYNDQMRVHRFAWPGIVKISYRRSTFSIRLKPGELDQKKEASISYCLTDYQHAKLLWKCAVEHHGFFRLVQPEPKQKHSFLSFGSARFRYTGRTNVQSQMASQLFENSAPITGDHPSKSKSEEMIAQHHKEHSTPLNFVDELSPQKQLNQVKPMATSTAKKEKHRKDKQKDGKKEKKTKKAIGAASTSSSSSSTSSSSTDAEAEEVHLLYHHPGQKQQQQQHDVAFGNEQTQKVTMTSAPYTLVVDPNVFDPIQHTTVETWHEEKIGPEQVTTEIDEEGNIIKRITRTEQIRHTVQTQSFEPVLVDEIENSIPAQPLRQNVPPPPPARRSVVFENGHKGQNGVSDESGELVSTKVVTTGNRTVETLTYKTEKDGMSETRVEHRITIHSNEEIDHDAELSRAILEATSMNPELKVEKVEVDRGGLKK